MYITCNRYIDIDISNMFYIIHYIESYIICIYVHYIIYTCVYVCILIQENLSMSHYFTKSYFVGFWPNI